MVDEMEDNGLARKLLPRILRGVFWSFIMGGEILLLDMLPGFREYATFFFPTEEKFTSIVFLFIIFEFVIQLTSGTIFPFALSGARSMITMFLIYSWTNGGVVKIDVPVEGITVGIKADFRLILNILLLIFLLIILKNIMGGVNFLYQKEEGDRNET